MEPECLPARQHSMDIITVYFQNTHLCTSSVNRAGRDLSCTLAKRRNYRVFGALPSCSVPHAANRHPWRSDVKPSLAMQSSQKFAGECFCGGGPSRQWPSASDGQSSLSNLRARTAYP
jgi:hypothetical protein